MDINMNIPQRIRHGWKHEYFKYFTIEPGDVVLDFGASKGDFASLCLEVSGVTCISVEASHFSSLPLENALNGWNQALQEKRFIPVRRAITGNITGKFLKIDTNIAGGNRWSTLNCIAIDDRKLTLFPPTDPEKEGYVETISFMDLVKQNNVTKIDFMKMDIEGSEYSIFKNKESFDFILKNSNKIVIEFHLQYLKEILNHTPEEAVQITENIMDRFRKAKFSTVVSPRDRYRKIDSKTATNETQCLDFWAYK